MQTVALVRRSRSRQQRQATRFFYLCYLPLNFILLYAACLTQFPWMPVVKEAQQPAWLESYGPELWFSFHLILAVLIYTIAFWLSRYCYHPRRFLWLPVCLGLLALLLMQPEIFFSLIHYHP